MATTLTTAVAKHFIKVHGAGRKVYNDRLTTGERSLKVTGWGLGNYTDAANLLQLAGCKVELKQSIRTSPHSGKEYILTRLHVKEPA